MTQQVNAEIVAIGTEILLGEITDTNSVYIAKALRDIGINLYFMTSVGDNESRIESALRIAMSRADVVITCGGLGPTIDDMTRQAVAAATERGLTFHETLLQAIAERFAGFRVQMTENNRRQAFLPDHAIVIENPVGTAPSFIVEHQGKVVISLPGVPREMKYLMTESVVPYLRQKFGLGGTIIKARVLKTAGIGESALDELIGQAALEAANPTVGLAAHTGQVDVRITAKAESLEAAERLIAVVEADLRTRIDPYVYAVDTGTIEDALVGVLRGQNAQMVVCEAGINPVISTRIQAVPQHEQVMTAAVHFMNMEAVSAALELADTLPLRQLAERAAEIFAQRQNADVGIAIVCQPDDAADQADNTEGSAVAVMVRGKTVSRAYGFGGANEMAQVWTATWGMAMAWRLLRERDL
ncbi:MAG: CinA family nicotinamide mononucleotide deamidase-related protein [bacterium]|nr:CinA family nicotinamide mononucleotide deamidase-related protein [bacterium]